ADGVIKRSSESFKVVWSLNCALKPLGDSLAWDLTAMQWAAYRSVNRKLTCMPCWTSRYLNCLFPSHDILWVSACRRISLKGSRVGSIFSIVLCRPVTAGPDGCSRRLDGS